mmetsp:Transcript_38796/g.91631  ORF Transcript_38796/g.91631 Transcript_38796/m.91631 type:complete len:431 (+) Transcript_38796:119-1411(+)
MPPHNVEPVYNADVGSTHSSTPANSELVMVTGYTDIAKLAHTPTGEEGSGIYAFTLNSHSGKLTAEGSMQVSPNPAFLVKHPKLDIVYGTTECIDQPGEVLTFALDSNAPSKMKLMDRQQAGGRSTCYLKVSQDCSTMTAVNYWDAKVCVLPLTESGEAKSVSFTANHPGNEYVEQNNPDRTEHWQYRQRWPHSHCAEVEPYSSGQGRFYVCDLGRDSVMEYEMEKDQTLRRTGEVKLQAGLGPRHCVFHPRVKACFIVNELTSSVSVYKYNKKELDGGEEEASTPGALLEHVQTLSTLPVDWQDKQTIKNGVWKAASHCSEIRIHPSGRLLFVGNRGHDSLAVFKIDERKGGELTLACIQPSNGECPRNYNFSATGQWCVIGNQNSNNVSVFEVDVDNGTLALKSQLPCPSPNYVYFIPKSTLVPSTGN